MLRHNTFDIQLGKSPLCDSCDCSPKECLSTNLFGNFFVPLQSGSEFTVSPAFSTVSRQVTQQHQQHFAMYDVKQISKLETLYFKPFPCLIGQDRAAMFPTKETSEHEQAGEFLIDESVLLPVPRSEYSQTLFILTLLRSQKMSVLTMFLRTYV